MAGPLIQLCTVGSSGPSPQILKIATQVDRVVKDANVKLAFINQNIVIRFMKLWLDHIRILC